jgi:transposase
MNEMRTKVDEAEFLTLERSGMTAREIAERLGVATRTVVRWRNRLHLSHVATAATFTDEQRELARRLIEDGCSFQEVARTVGVSHWTIRRWFPDTPAWTRQQIGEHAALMRRMNRTLERNAA